MTNDTFIIRLENVGRNDLSTAGGKGANLGEMVGAGFPVPGGFVVAVEACRRFFEHIGLEREVEGLKTAFPEEVEEICGALHEHIHRCELPPEMARAILEAHGELVEKRGPDVLVAVRSSSTAEDLGEASFAGQHDTYYDVKADNLLEMVKRCWGSLFSSEAVSYRNTQRIDHLSVFMAVVVQEMVFSEASGVTFTANPVTGSRKEVVIESSWGMGAAIVDGRVTPDHYVVSRDGLEVKERRIGRKTLMCPPHSSGGGAFKYEEVPPDKQEAETLTPDQVKTVAEWAIRAEEHFGSPQDLEWGIYRGEFFLLQSRPITIMGPEDIARGVEGKWVLFKPIVENFTDPMTPLSASLVGQTMAALAIPGLRVIRGWLYLNIDIFRRILPFPLTDSDAFELLYSFSGKQTPKVSMARLPSVLALGFLAYLTSGVLFARTRRMPYGFMEGYRKLARRVDEDDACGLRDGIIRLWTWPNLFYPVGNLVTLINASAVRYMIGMKILKRLVRRWAPDLPENAESLLCSGSEGMMSAEMGREIRAMAQEVERHSALKEIFMKRPLEVVPAEIRGITEGAGFLTLFDRFLDDHGHRGVKELELRSTRWRENPSPVLNMIKNNLLADSDPLEQERKKEKARAAVEAELQKTLDERFLERSAGWRRRMISHVAKRTRYFARLRENTRYYHVLGLYILRRKALRIEADLIRKGKLKSKDDVFYLRLDELEDLMAGRLHTGDAEERIRDRRVEQIRLLKMMPPKTLGFKVEVAPAGGDEGPEDPDLLRGQSASPGRHRGRAHVILDPSQDVSLKPGEVLVAPYTDPAWTPLFLTAGASVIEVGSYLSHAGTVAREFGMPCVVEIPGATKRIKSGMMVDVDGDRGLVRILRDRKEAGE